MSDIPLQYGLVRRLGRPLGPALFVLILLVAPAELSPEAARTLAVAGWMVVWWISEAVPLAATALLPLVLFPLLGVATISAAATPYANELIFLFLGGFLLAAGLERWRCHARIAYHLVLRTGRSARSAIFGVMLATAVISMWVSNTATAAMMFPIAVAVGELFGPGPGAARSRTALMLGMAYAASIGGMATLIGTPPNLIFAGAARQLLDYTVTFGSFMELGLPIMLVLLPLCWGVLTLVLFRAHVPLGEETRRVIREQQRALGPFKGGEALTFLIFALTALAWLLREPKTFGELEVPGLATLAPGLTDGGIALIGALLLFLVHGRERDGSRRPLLTWDEASTIPWEVLLLFGGGLSLAAAMDSSGLSVWIGGALQGMSGWSGPLVALGLAVTVLALSELASNTAVAAMVMPLASSLAIATGQEPLTLMLVATFAASTGFALPVATPPNAIVFGSGQVQMRDMLRAGLVLDLLAVGVIVLVVGLIGA